MMADISTKDERNTYMTVLYMASGAGSITALVSSYILLNMFLTSYLLLWTIVFAISVACLLLLLVSVSDTLQPSER